MESSPDALQTRGNISQDSVAIRAVKDITFGSIAGMVSKVFEHPFDLTKVRLQSQVLDDTARFSGPLDCLTQTFKKEGIRGLYRGLPAPIVGAMAENASMFMSYNELQNAVRWASATPLDQQLSLGQLAIAAAGAGSITSFFLTPIELVKCKMQVQMLMPPSLSSTLPASSPSPITPSLTPSLHPAAPKIPLPPAKLPGPISVLMSVIRQTGFRGLWLGQTGTLIRETGGGAAWFCSKEAVARFLVSRRSPSSSSSPERGTNGKLELKTWESAVSGAFAGIAYNIALFPADTVKSAMQTEAELRPGSKEASSFWGTAKEMFRVGGIKGLYAGCGITVARAIPSSALIFIIYDGLSKRFGS
ncbi:mitochondrial carrier domain-containing protein [Abortiporus biennis]|nr:mitochondrial carrier domain-containing protein [Abortiporus biennis]